METAQASLNTETEGPGKGDLEIPTCPDSPIHRQEANPLRESTDKPWLPPAPPLGSPPGTQSPGPPSARAPHPPEPPHLCQSWPKIQDGPSAALAPSPGVQEASLWNEALLKLAGETARWQETRVPIWNLPLTLCVLVRITSSLGASVSPSISLSISVSLMGHLCSCPHAVQNPPLWPGPCCLFPGAAQALLIGLLASGLALTVWAPLRGQRDLLQPNSVTSPRCSKAVTPHLMQVKPSPWPLLSDPTLPAQLPLPTAWNLLPPQLSCLCAWLLAPRKRHLPRDTCSDHPV